MSTYDIAAGASPAGLNALVGQLFANPAAKKGLFSGTVTQNVDTLGSVKVTYDITAAPTFVLTPPTPQQWKGVQPPNLPLPNVNAFQLVLSNVAGTAAIAGAPPLAAHGAVTAFGTVSTQGGAVSLTVVAILLDESSFSGWDKLIVNAILIPALLTALNKLVSGLPLPKPPGLAGLQFQPLTLAVMPQGIAIATSFSDGPAPNLSGFTAPAPNLYAVTKLTAINRLLAAEIKGPFSDEGSKGPSGWKASGRVSVNDPKLTISIGGALTLNVSGTFQAYGELSGAGVGVTKAVLCPIGAAADAIANPSNWDKVISSFQLVYSPDPMPLPVSVTASAVTGSGSSQSQPVDIKILSDKLPSSIKLTVKPTWSGSVTGAALAAAASAFVDLVSVIFGSLIIKKIVAAYGHKSFSLPVSEMQKAIQLPQGGKVTVSLSASVGAALQPFGNDQLVQSLQVAIT